MLLAFGQKLETIAVDKVRTKEPASKPKECRREPEPMNQMRQISQALQV